jgi:hypothetical protein
MIESRSQPGRAFIAHQHEEVLLVEVGRRFRIETGWAVLDGIKPVARWTEAALGHDPVFPKATEQAHKHRRAINHIVEAVKPRLGHLRHYIPVCAKHVICKWPSDEIHVRDELELVLDSDFPPECTLIGHMLREANCLWLGDWHFEDRRDLGPKISPSEIVAICDVEGFISASLIRRSPQRTAKCVDSVTR